MNLRKLNKSCLIESMLNTIFRINRLLYWQYHWPVNYLNFIPFPWFICLIRSSAYDFFENATVLIWADIHFDSLSHLKFELVLKCNCKLRNELMKDWFPPTIDEETSEHNVNLLLGLGLGVFGVLTPILQIGLANHYFKSNHIWCNVLKAHLEDNEPLRSCIPLRWFTMSRELTKNRNLYKK